MQRLLVFIILLTAVIAINGCYYDVEEELYPATGAVVCDTSAITYALTVKPILDNNNCMDCHNAAAPQGNVILETHADLINYVNSGQLLGAIKHQSGFSPMPQGGGKLNDCNILKIEKWIQSGSPNN